ncbi:MAG TPA: LuxR C-terminal-related transcriptional regulator [Candidatus Limnocylindrales bacterium]|nr:LuxR C-terminal-related transcriptional regulator [Candidatus Limnocylindrales bacterium]
MDRRLLQTKLHAPHARGGAVVRQRLADRLSRGVQSKLTLASAPPGFGKSTLVGAWIEAQDPPAATAWLSLDPEDNDPATFWAYVVAALTTAVPTIGASASAALESAQPQVDLALRALINELAATRDDVVLVLDDYHVIDRPDIHDGVATLIDRLPPTAHLVIATRSDPPLPLSRLRARGELTEIRAADLRFTPDEAAAYLNGSMGLELASAEVAALEARTEGWIAALQLAALSVNGRTDAASFIASFAGDDRYIVDYLVDEVLARQTDDVRTFLLDTAVLDRLTGALCDAVTGRNDGRTQLEALDRANLFLIALDDRRRWYRYHHLFADVLRARLLDERPGAVPGLHRRASDWFEANGDHPEAIRHALASSDFERAATLIELATPDMQRTRRETTLRRWMAALPANVFESRPVLSIGFVGALMADGTTEGVEPHLARVERWLEADGATQAGQANEPGRTVVVDAAQVRQLPRAVATYRAALALTQGDLPATTDHARRAMDLAADDDHLGRGAAAALLGLAQWTGGDLDAAYQSYAEGMASLDRAGHDADVVGGAITLAEIRIVQGRLDDAMRHFERGLARATRAGKPVLRGAADMHVGIGGVLRERGDLAGAIEHLSASRALGAELGLPQHPWRWRVAAAHIRRAEGDLDGALRLIEDAEPVYTTDFAPNVRPIEAVKATVWIAQGRLEPAWEWARKRNLTPSDDLAYLHEFEHLTLARLLLADAVRRGDDRQLDGTIGLAERLRVAAEAAGRYGSAIAIAIVESLARQARADSAGALEALDRAVSLAEPEGYLGVFLIEGEPMTALLRFAVKQRRASPYLHRLLESAAAPASGPSPAAQPLVEPLSERELEVLRLLHGDLDGPEIARHLFVSVNTVRTHTKNIYAKLGVNNRRAAVRRAGELGLVPREDRPSA